jgi:BirA family biotin operon repressor/biotin-[acetyl-CoA-carboxylase] ligase
MPTPLDLAAISTALGHFGTTARRFDVDLLAECSSTNSVLLERAEAGAPSGTVVIATSQTAGRGRRGREWLSAAGDSLTFSLFWRFAPGTSPAGLSLAVGLAVANAIEKVGTGKMKCPAWGTASITLKWPNDLLRAGKKLGGILIELLPGAPHAAIIGIGLNLRLPPALPDELRPCTAALDSETDPNALLAAILVELAEVLDRFAATGFAGLRDDWSARHAYSDTAVQISSGFAPPRQGMCRGVDHDGALLLETSDGLERVLSGEVSLRPLPLESA